MSALRLPVRTRDIVAGDGSRTRALQVFCPRRDRSVDVDGCRACEHVQRVTAEDVQCAPPEGRPTIGPDAPAGAAGSATITYARADVVGATLVPMIPLEPWALPIVDEQGRFLGFVSMSELAISELPWRLVLAMPARDLVVGASLAVHEADPLRRALRLMAHRRVRAVALIDDAGTAQGVLTDIGALRAITSQTRSER